MTAESALTLEYQPPKGKGKGTVTARLPGGESYTDRVDLADAADRDRFLKALCKGRKGVAKLKKAVAAELERLAGEAAAKSGEGGRRSQADVLLTLAVGLDLFHAPGNGGEGEAFASFTS